MTVTTPNPVVGQVEAVAATLDGLVGTTARSIGPSPSTTPSVAIPATGPLRRHLLGEDDRPRHVGLARAVRVLRRWKWRLVGRDWLVGSLGSTGAE